MKGCRHLVLLGDGMGDRPREELGGRTPLQAARTPNMDRIAADGALGVTRTLPEGMPKGSDVANLSVLGYDPASVYTGRSPLEAAGMAVELGEEDVAFRCNLVTLETGEGSTSLPGGKLDPAWRMADFAGGHPTAEESAALVEALQEGLGGDGIEFHVGVSYRHLMVWRKGREGMEVVPPHDLTGSPIGEGWPRGEAAERILRLSGRAVELLARHPVNLARLDAGRAPVNAVWLWGQGRPPRLEPFQRRYGLRGAMITAVDLLRGIGALLGFEVLRVPGATGYLDTDYRAKAEAALEALGRVELVYLHVEAPDEASHEGSLEEKLLALERFDSLVVGPALEGLKAMGPHRVLLMPDHATPLEIMTHDSDPVPFAVYDSSARGSGSGGTFNEPAAAATGLVVERAHEIMGRFIRGELSPR